MSAPIRMFLAEKPSAEVRAALERLARGDGVVAIAAMPDLHLAHDVCIGTVVATDGALYPSAVGGDIGCGVAALGFDVAASALDRKAAARVLHGLAERVPILRKPGRRTLPEALAKAALSHPSLARHLERDGAAQIGTVGRGNHFVELQRDPSGALWLMVHSGSRSLGQVVRDHHLAGGLTGGNGMTYLQLGSEDGRAYLADMEVARTYASVNRRSIVDAVAGVLAEVLDAVPLAETFLDCDHNHCELEGSSVLIHRKGAISARQGQPGIIPGSMGSPSYHVEGRGMPASLWSSSHGAGRLMSRDAARRAISVSELERQVGGVYFDHRQARRLRDEAPGAYKDITAVMRAQRELTRIVRELWPVLSFKGG